MNGLEAWAYGPGGTAALLACMLALGLILGWLARDTAVRRALADRRGEAEGARYVGELLRPLPEPGYMTGYRLSVNGQEVYDWKHDDPEPFSPEAATRALALVQPETDEEWFGTHVAAVADEIIGWARAASVPYPDGEPRSGQ